MMNRSKYAAVILVAGLMSLPALAQDKPAGSGGPPGGAGGPPPRGQSGPPRGPGGAGGGPGGGMGGGMFGRPRLAPEKAKAAWEVQAKGVAADLSLDEAATGKVVAAYTTARTNHDAAIAKLMQEMIDARMADGGPDAAGPGGGGGAPAGPDDGGGPPKRGGGGAPEGGAGGPPPGGPGAGPGGRGGMFGDMQKKMADLTKADRDSLKAELAKSLDAGKTDTAMASLGTFNPAWDVAVDAITGFKLDAAKNTAALNTLKAYNLELGKITPSEDREAMRTANTAARKTMTDSLKNILTEDQMKQFDAATAMGRGGRGGQGRGGRPPEGEL